MPTVTVAFAADELETLDVWALLAHGGDREAAVEALVSEWLDNRGRRGTSSPFYPNGEA